jgi:hypothetical protein
VPRNCQLLAIITQKQRLETTKKLERQLCESLSLLPFCAGLCGYTGGCVCGIGCNGSGAPVAVNLKNKSNTKSLTRVVFVLHFFLFSIPASSNPSWNSVLSCEDAAGKTLTISVYDSDDAVVSSMTVPMDQLMEQSTVAMDADGSSGSTVLAVHCEEYVLEPGTLQLKLEGHGLKNTERGLGLIRKSDPFYVISGGYVACSVLFAQDVYFARSMPEACMH